MLIMTCQNPIHVYNKIRKLHAYVNIQVLLMAYIPRFLKFDKHQNFADGTEFWQTERSALGFRTRSCMGMVALNNRDFFFFFFEKINNRDYDSRSWIYNEWSLGKWEMT